MAFRQESKFRTKSRMELRIYVHLVHLNNINIMRKIITILFITVILLTTSCRWGLEELPVFDEADIISINFETRWIDQNTSTFRAQELTVTEQEINDNVITLKLIVPPSSANFPEEIRNEVELGRLVMYCNISNAATIKPIGTAPVLGTIGDFSQNNIQYEVVAADGVTRKIWTIDILDFVK